MPFGQAVPSAADQPLGFRAQQRFSDPSATVPAEWTAVTPPNGIPKVTLPPEPPERPGPSVTLVDLEPVGLSGLDEGYPDPPSYLDLSTVALLESRSASPPKVGDALSTLRRAR